MIAFIHANLIDGTGAPPVAGATVLIEGGIIKAAGKNIPVPDGSTVIDLSGKTLMPGLIDCHAHIGGRDFPVGLDDAKSSHDYAPMRESALAAGVTTIRSCGDFLEDSVAVRDKISQGLLRGPRLICCGKSFQKKGGHPNSTVWGNVEPTCAEAGAYPENPAQARSMVRELVDKGVDWIKIIVADSHIFVFPGKLAPISDENIETIIDEAHKYGKRVVCHIDSAPDAIKVMKLGADEVDHLIAMGSDEPDESVYDECFRMMIERRVWFAPTIVVPRTFEPMRSQKGTTGGIDYCIPHYKKAYEYGVPMGCGCDSGCPGVPWGPSMHAELKEYVYSLGVKPLEAIRFATGNNAALLGIEDKVGTVKEGLLADLMVVDGDPSEKIEDLDKIRLVMREGSVVVDRLPS